MQVPNHFFFVLLMALCLLSYHQFIEVQKKDPHKKNDNLPCHPRSRLRWNRIEACHTNQRWRFHQHEIDRFQHLRDPNRRPCDLLFAEELGFCTSTMLHGLYHAQEQSDDDASRACLAFSPPPPFYNESQTSLKSAASGSTQRERERERERGLMVSSGANDVFPAFTSSCMGISVFELCLQFQWMREIWFLVWGFLGCPPSLIPTILK